MSTPLPLPVSVSSTLEGQFWQIFALLAESARHKTSIERQDAQIKFLTDALRTVAGPHRAQEMMARCGLFPELVNVDIGVNIKYEEENIGEENSQDGSVDSDGYDADLDDDEEEEEENEEKLLSSVDSECEEEKGYVYWDDTDQVHRCSLCSWEAVGGVCQGVDCQAVLDTEEYEEEFCDSIENMAYREDIMAPIRGVDKLKPLPCKIECPKGYKNDKETFVALLQRGATSLMCARYKLFLHENLGIYAIADEELLDQFRGRDMGPDDTWTIYLGRMIVLDEDDADGSRFIQDLLEDVLTYPLRSKIDDGWADGERWTTERAEGLPFSKRGGSTCVDWITKPILVRAADDLGGGDDKDYASDDDSHDSSNSGLEEELRSLAGIEWKYPRVQSQAVISTREQYEGSDITDSESGDSDYRVEELEGRSDRSGASSAIEASSDDEGHGEMMDNISYVMWTAPSSSSSEFTIAIEDSVTGYMISMLHDNKKGR